MLPSLLWNRDPTNILEQRAEDWLTSIDAAALIETMADKDSLIRDAAQKTLLMAASITMDEIPYRQEIVRDALSCEKPLGALYRALCAGLDEYEDARRKSQPGYARFAPMIERVRAAAGMLGILLSLAGDVKRQFRANSGRYVSEGMRAYIEAFLKFYDDAFMRDACEKQKQAAAFSDGSRVCIGAKLGNGLKCADLHIRAVEPFKKLRRVKGVSYVSLESANLQSKAISLRDAALAGILHLLSTVNAQIAKDLTRLQSEVGFYLGCARLHGKLAGLGVPLCWPKAHVPEEYTLNFEELVDAGLALRMGEHPIGNTLGLDGRELIVITGANQGGKSTFLRSVGLAQVMMQCGMFVAARSFESSVADGLYAHFCHGEDGGMDSGKLDEELGRMNLIVDQTGPCSMVLMNESFSSTTEREGSAIAREITLALTALGVRVLFVTHLYDYAKSMENLKSPNTALLRAERDEQGNRSFHIRPGVARPTSHGLDLYMRILEQSLRNGA